MALVLSAVAGVPAHAQAAVVADDIASSDKAPGAEDEQDHAKTTPDKVFIFGRKVESSIGVAF